MSAIQADWFVGDLDLEDQVDPFSTDQVGTPIDLSNPLGRLDARLVELMEREERLASTGLTCSIKDHSDTSCSACPFSAHDRREEALGTLCRIGREQERVLTERIGMHVQAGG